MSTLYTTETSVSRSAGRNVCVTSKQTHLSLQTECMWILGWNGPSEMENFYGLLTLCAVLVPIKLDQNYASYWSHRLFLWSSTHSYYSSLHKWTGYMIILCRLTISLWRFRLCILCYTSSLLQTTLFIELNGGNYVYNVQMHLHSLLGDRSQYVLPFFITWSHNNNKQMDVIHETAWH